MVVLLTSSDRCEVRPTNTSDPNIGEVILNVVMDSRISILFLLPPVPGSPSYISTSTQIVTSFPKDFPHYTLLKRSQSAYFVPPRRLSPCSSDTLKCYLTLSFRVLPSSRITYVPPRTLYRSSTLSSRRSERSLNCRSAYP